ncbi:MAG: P-loop NTPase fold protein [Alphaproteobacteria bacterium]|nr:P-loop NTPase fold protein [Alphaproteobacteria bacterium]
MGVQTFEQRDEFLRKPIAEKAITLLRSEADVSPMIIDGSWGTGKSEFCQKMISLFDQIQQEEDNQQKHTLIYIDAFASDHNNEPLLTILAEITKRTPKSKSKKEIIKKILPAIRFITKTGLKAGANHLLKQDSSEIVENFENEILATAEKTIDAGIETLLKDFEEAEKNMHALKSAIDEITSETPMVIFIDELDRCRPDYAINLLEIIKHTFVSDGLQFVLVTNSHQLRASINHCYGANVDAARYLDKFLKFRFRLPKLVQENFRNRNISIQHFKSLIVKSNILETSKIAELSFPMKLIEVKDLSLREVETFVRHLEIYNTLSNPTDRLTNSDMHYIFLSKFVLGVAIALWSPDLASSILERTARSEDICAFLDIQKISFHEFRDSSCFHAFCYILSRNNSPNLIDVLPLQTVESLLDETFLDIYPSSFFDLEINELSAPITNAINTMNFVALDH